MNPAHDADRVVEGVEVPGEEARLVRLKKLKSFGELVAGADDLTQLERLLSCFESAVGALDSAFHGNPASVNSHGVSDRCAGLADRLALG
jgi:hypothetical protein